MAWYVFRFPQNVLDRLAILAITASSTRVGASGRDLPCSQFRSVDAPRPDSQGLVQVKFAASSMLPEPLYCATCG